ncbi:MAG: hypothetical protein JWQ81_1690 [Amycolatopsis sp.]|jgi:hypothetical protein|uniref:hypothetical protein n=1 Tax=Amycolatopsis sp. TaxID=37632 RepID=UPI0026019CC2|nr:hypothetical protein [Amycolatopsis sp.]MCU1680951.1 hypothetical protein [Amycolatopsis sp.]
MTATIRTCVLGCSCNDGVAYRAAPGRLACDPCSEKLAKAVTELGRLYYELTDVEELIPGGSGSNAGGSRPVPGPRSPAVDGLIVHTDVRSSTSAGQPPAALASIAGWAREVREERSLDTARDQLRGTVPDGRVTMAREIGTLKFEWHWVMGQEWLADFAAEVHAVLAALRSAGRMDAPTIRLGTCTVRVLGIDTATRPVTLECGARLRVRTDATELRCSNCGTVWPRSRWHELGDGQSDYARLAEELGVPVGTLRRWSHEDSWTVSGTRSRRLVTRAQALESFRKRRGALPLEQAG